MKKLGIIYTQESTKFRVLAPTVSDVKLLIYADSQSIDREEHEMEKDSDGIYHIELMGDYNGKFYTYLVDHTNEVTDPYSYATSQNGVRSAIINLDDTNPVGFKNHRIPYRKNLCNSVIYEVHVKDFTVDKSSNVKHRGKYLGFVEAGSTYNGLTTGIDHLKELGITHVHLMPVYDFVTVAEDKELFYNDNNYNWGYDPEHYNVPEGSYSLKPENPTERIKELKTLIMKLHEAGISVVIDVVYNHTYRNKESNFNVLYPNYYHRTLDDGSFSDGSGCGNELATEREMVKEFIKYSLMYWLREFKVDGFRFDLMALMDKDTLEEIVVDLKDMKNDILIFGEPWTAGPTVLDYTKLSLKGSQYNKGFGFFNDNFRDAIKGDNNGLQTGFVQGNINFKSEVKTGLVGSIAYDENHIGFAANSSETINYANSHDNLILADKLALTFRNASHKELIRYNKFALSIVLMSQGIPFIHAGNEFLRSKNFDINSYQSPISTNAIDWSQKEKNIDLFNYMKELIDFKKSFNEFGLCNSVKIREKIKFLDTNSEENLIAYTMELEKAKKYFIFIFNGNSEEKLIFTENIKRHLGYHLKQKIIDIDLNKYFGMNGYIRESEDRWDDYGIITRPRSTAVWEIIINEAKEA